MMGTGKVVAMTTHVLTITTITDQTFRFRAQSEEKDENGLPGVNNFDRLRAVVESENPEAVFECEDLEGHQRTVRAAEVAKFSVGLDG